VRILIVGADRLGRVLAGDLLQSGHDVRVLDARSELLRQLSHEFEGRTVHGSPLDQATLSGAADGCDAIGCVSEDDNLNAVVALAARRELHVPLALAVIANPRRAEALTGLGARVVCPTARTAHALHLALVRSGLETEVVLGGDLAVYRIEIPPRLAGRSLSELGPPDEVLAVAVERRSHMLLATPERVLQEGDVLHLAATRHDRISELTRP
jgi:trk system potassium uptake protein TrkA